MRGRRRHCPESGFPAGRPAHFLFTLIELLIMIAIVAITAALLFPLRRPARQVGDYGNYASRHKGLPPSSASTAIWTPRTY